MLLQDFTLISPDIKPGELFQAIETAIPANKITEAIDATDSREQRNRRLPTHMVIALVIAMHFWSDDSVVDVIKNLVSGLSGDWIRLSQRWRVPSKSSITEARQRVGPRVVSHLFALIVHPLATLQTPGAFLGGLRIMSLDGTLFDVPDTDANASVFGYPGSRAGTRSAFPKARLVILVEAGTHLITDALICPYRMGERVRAIKLLRSVSEGMLLMWDRGLHSYKMVNATLKQKCHLLGRVPANVKFERVKDLADGSYLSWIAPDRKSKKKGGTRIQVRVIEYTMEEAAEPQVYRLITDLLDIALFPALLLAKEYHQRWEVENTLDELKTHLNGRKTPIRSKNPREVIQEVYGWLLAHWAIRCLMFQAAQQREISPLSIGFTGTLKVLRRAVPTFQAASAKDLLFSQLASARDFRTDPTPSTGKEQSQSCQQAKVKVPLKKTSTQRLWN